MRSRLFVSSFLALATLACSLRAQDSGDRYSDGLIAGDYLRIAAGMMSPVHPQGSLRDWDRGKNFALGYENWSAAGGSVSRVSYGLIAEYSMLPLNQKQFLLDYTPPANAVATSATASNASVFLIGTNARIRFPSPFIMPSVQIAFSFLNYSPATIHYVSSAGGGTASEEHRRGAAFSFGAGLDKHIYDRFAIYGEAVYTYGFTSLGQGYTTPGGTCSVNGCDPLKNTAVGVIRGGLRVQTSR